MHNTQRCFLASGCSPRRQQRNVAEGSPPGEPIGHALVTVRHKRRRRAESPPTAAQSGRRLAPRRAHRTRAGGGETQAPEARRNVPQVRAPRPARPGQGPQRRPLRAPWVRIRGAATTAMSLHRRGAATTKTGPCRRNPSGRWGSRPISSLLVVDDARASTPPRALTSAREPHRRTALGAPAGPLGRKHRWARHLAALAMKPGEKCRLALFFSRAAHVGASDQ